MHVLHEEKGDADVLAYALESLCNVLLPVSDDNEALGMCECMCGCTCVCACV